MQQQSQSNPLEDVKRNFNMGFAILVVIQRCFIVPIRTRFGVEALGMVCIFSFLLMLAVAAVSGDPFMWAYLVFWTVLVLRRRHQARQLLNRGDRIHSESDGWPSAAMKIPFVKSQRAAIQVAEPLFVFLYGVAFWFVALYLETPAALAYFLMVGAIAMRSVATIQWRIFERRTHSMLNSRLEQQAVMEEFRGKWGDS